MSKRLLSVLFPNFVKKEYSQSQRVSQGPFGEGLEKARTYLKPGEQSPEGANVQTGPQGGKYFDDMGGGGAATQDSSAQGGYDIDYGDPERSAQVREDLDQEGMGVPPAPEAGPEISEDRNVVGGIDYGPAKPEAQNAQDFGEAAKREGTLRWGSSPAAAEALSTGRIVYGGVDYGPSNMEPINLPDTASTDERFDANERQEAQEEADYQTAKEGGYSTTTIGTSLGDVPWYGTGDEGPFPGSDEWYEENREELEAKGKPTSHEELLAANEEEAKRSEGMYPKQTSPPEQTEYDGYVGARAVEAEKKANEFIEGVGDHLMDQATSNDPAEISDAIDGYAASRAYFPGSETYDKLQEAGQRFMAERKDESADYYGEDYALMAKMMQEYNINNRRSDPVILSNKGGSQRRSLQKATSTTSGFKKAGPHKYSSRTPKPGGGFDYTYPEDLQADVAPGSHAGIDVSGVPDEHHDSAVEAIRAWKDHDGMKHFGMGGRQTSDEAASWRADQANLGHHLGSLGVESYQWNQHTRDGVNPAAAKEGAGLTEHYGKYRNFSTDMGLS